jgi:D-alanine--poly(phosphoribitol) ligase subunit 1
MIIMTYENKETLDISFIRRKLGEVIPKYMIPNKFVHYLKMPMNANGKIDRLKIKEEILSE